MILWFSEAFWIGLVVFVGVGGQYDLYVQQTSVAIVVSLLILFGLTGVTAVAQFCYWIFRCGAGKDDDYSRMK